MEPSELLQGRTRETTIRRDQAGNWYNQGQRLEHPNLCRSFDGWIDRAEDGRYCLSNDINWAYVEIEGPPYRVRDAQIGDDGTVALQLSGDRTEPLVPSSLRQDEDGALYCDVREGRCAARFDNHAAMKLGTLLGEDEIGTYLLFGDAKIRPAVSPEPLAPAAG